MKLEKQPFLGNIAVLDVLAGGHPRSVACSDQIVVATRPSLECRLHSSSNGRQSP